MSFLKAKFPGKPRHFHDSTGSTKEVQRISYAERIHDWEFQQFQGHNDYSSIASQTAANFRAFRKFFGSDDETQEEFLGFDDKTAQNIKSKVVNIQRDINLLEKEISINEPFKRSSQNEQIPFQNFCASKRPRSSSDKVKNSGSKDKVDRRRAATPRNGKYGHTTMLSPLPVSFAQLKPSTLDINAIPMVRCLDDIPNPVNSASSSGKFIIENELDSDEEGIGNKENNDEDTLLSRRKRPEAEKGLIRFNRYPTDIDEIEVYGCAVIIDKVHGALPPKPLCFCCGSAGIEQLIYCSSCCEPYHPFCSGDDSLLSSYVSRILPKTKVRLPELNNENCSEVTSIQEDFVHLKAQTHIPIYYNQAAEGTSSKTDFVNPLSSLLSPPLTPMPMISYELDLEKEKEVELQNLLRSWICRRCYTCHVCKVHREPETGKELRFLKCVHCPRVVHLSCSNTKKISDKWICDDCFKCKSCGKLIERRAITSTVRTKESSVQMLCLECFRQKQKGSFCPVCEVCYDDDDYETRMMECGKCERWIHAKCERIGEEQYQILSNLPESIEYICRICEDPCGVFWRQAVAMELSNGCESVLRIFQKKAISSCRKLRVLQPSHENNPHEESSHQGDVTDGSVEHHPVHHVSSFPSPSSEENKKIVRELFPQHLEPDVAEKELAVPPRRNKQNQQGKQFKTREVSVRLYDYRKYPNILLTKSQEENLPPSSIQCKIVPSSDDVKVEVQEHRTPIKPLLVEILPSKLPFSPTKRINTLLDTVVQNIKFTSVMSIYEEALYSLKRLEESDADSNSAQLQIHFESALKEVFPWFSPEEISNANLKSEKELEVGKSLGAGNYFNSVSSEGVFSKNSEILLKPIQAHEELGCENPFADVYWDKTNHVDTRRCSLCHEVGDFPPDFSGRLLWAGLCDWVHVNCALWSSEVWEEVDGALQQVGVALARSKNLSCEVCERKGASVSCCAQYCRKSFHFPCALNSSCILLEDKAIFCPDHVKKAKGLRQQDMQVLRQVYIGTDWLRKKEKQAWSDDLVVVIGSLRINSLGYIVPLSVQKTSDNIPSAAALLPLGYEVSRIFWSFDSSGTTEKVKYTITTGVKEKEARRSKYCKPQQDINIRIDHTKPRPHIIRKWNQVRAFHDWLESSPIYVDENGKEWLYPCNRTFTDSESSSGSDGDVEDGYSETEHDSLLTTESSTDYIHEDFFKDYLTDETIRHLSSCVEELIQENEDWGMEIMLNEDVTEITGDETEEDEDLVQKIKASMSTEGKNDAFFIPQIDGGGESDSESYTSDDITTSSSTSTSSSSSDEEEETRRKVPERKVNAQRPTRANSKKSIVNPIPKPSKLRQKLKSVPSTSSKLTMTTGKKSTTEFGGRKLRSRQKLKEAKIKAKKQEVKCQSCKKSFTSLASVKRHTNWCKPKKSALKENKRMKMTKVEPVLRQQKPKRGRKPKKPLIPASSAKEHKRTLERTTPSTPSPSTSRQMSSNPKQKEIGAKSVMKCKMEGPHVLRTNIEEHKLFESEISLNDAIGEDGKVHCRRCKNTYRTVLSYHNHTSNCFYFSSESEEEVAIEVPTVTILESIREETEIPESESEETTSDYSTSSNGSLLIPAPGASPSVGTTIDTSNEQIMASTEPNHLSQIPEPEMKVEKLEVESIEVKFQDQNVNVDEAELLVQCELPFVAEENMVIEAKTSNETVSHDANVEDIDTKELSMVSNDQAPHFVTQLENKDCALQLNEAESEGVEAELSVEEVYDENELSEFSEEFVENQLETNPEGDEEEEVMIYEDEADVLESVSQNQVSHFISSENVMNENVIEVVDYEVANPITSSEAQLRPLVMSPQCQTAQNWNGSNVQPFNESELLQHQHVIAQQQQHQHQLVESLHQNSVLQQMNPQSFQNPQQPQPFAQPQTIQVQQDIFPHEQQQQHLQTMTFQDSNGQLITLQLPIMQQMTPNQNSIPNSSFMSTTNQHPPHSYQQHQSHLPFQSLETQYEQYKHQIQAAIQLQRNSIQQHALFQQQQQAILEQQQARNDRILLQHQHQQQPLLSLQNSYLGSGQSATTPMLMSMNSNVFQQQHQQTAHVPVPIQAQPTVPATPSEGMTTYMVVQHGNTLSTIPIPFESQSTQNSTHHLTPIQISNSEFQGQRQSTHTPSPQHSTLLLPVLTSESQGQRQSQGMTSSVTVGNTSRVCLGQSTSNLNGNLCPCANCIYQNSVNLCDRKPSWKLKKASPTPSDGGCARKQKGSGKIRARLASMVTERQGPTLLPRLLPATTTLTTTTNTIGGFKSPGIGVVNLQSAAIATPTVTSDYFTGPIVSATATPSLLKAPTPSPNIAVVRPMEHPLQKMSDQIQQIESSFTTSSSQIRVSQSQVGTSVMANLNLILEDSTTQIVASETTNLPNLATTIPRKSIALDPVTVGSSVEEEGREFGVRQQILPLESIPNEIESKLRDIPKDITSCQPESSGQQHSQVEKSIKIQLKRQEGGDSYSINKISGSASTSTQLQGTFKTLKIKGKITTGDQAGTSTDVVVQPVVHTVPIPDPNANEDDDESNMTIVEEENTEGAENRKLETSLLLPVSSTLDLGVDDKGQPRKRPLRLTHRAVIVYEVKIDDKVQYKSCDVRAVWGYILERVQGTRRNHNLPPLSYPATNISLPENKREAAASFNKLGLTHRAVQFLLEQLPGVSKAAKEGHVFKFQEPPKTSIEDMPVVENPTGSARSEGYTGRKPFDLFGWLASKHRQPEGPITSTRTSDIIKGGSLPIAMKYRNLMKYGSKHLNVFWSSIHGRGLFTTKDIEANDVIIEYAGEEIRSVLCDLREKYYESKGIGCYMFRMDDNYVVDATLKGNAARFINHSCDPNCRSRIMDILGTKHILIFALRKIPSGEELTYDYKFEEEDGVKLPCSCGTHKCRKFLN